MAGLPGTGKSTLALALAERSGAVVLDKDYLRTALFPAEWIEYSREQDDFVVRVMLKVAGWILRREPRRMVVLDGRPFSKKYQLDHVIAFANWIKAPWAVIECTCSEETARKRLQAGGHPAADRNFELYQRVKAEFEPITAEKLLVDTDHPPSDVAEEMEQYILQRRSSNPGSTAEL